MAKVSLIVSVHNPGKYLVPMIDSLIAQTFKDIEILLIDDGSTDGSRNILKEYEQKDERIIAIFREQSPSEVFGQKYSADLGCSLAKGEYLMMLDHDDILPSNAVEKLYSYTNNGTIDVVQGREISVESDGTINFKTPEYFSEPYVITNLEELQEEILDLHLVYMPPSLWACLIRKEFYKNIELVDCIFNDTDCIWRLKLCAKSFCYIPDLVYIHNSYPESVSGMNQRDKYCFTLFHIFELLEEFVLSNNFSSKIQEKFYAYKFLKLYYPHTAVPITVREKYFKQLSKAIRFDKDISPFLTKFSLDATTLSYYLLARQYQE